MKPFLAILFIAALLGAAPAAAQTTVQTTGKNLRRVESELDKGRAQRDALKRRAVTYGHQLRRLKSAMVKAAAAIRQREAEALALEGRLRLLAATEAAKTARLQARRGQFTQVLMALQRIASRPPEAMFVAPQSPTDMIRGAILLRAAAPETERRAAVLRADLSALVEARAKSRGERQRLALTIGGLTKDRRRLESLMSEKSLLKGRTDAATHKAERRIRKLAGKAKNLRDLMALLEAERRRRAAAEPNPPKSRPKSKLATRLATRPITAARGELPFPVVGRLVGRYGQMTESGLTRKGITIETRPGAQVVAPYDGRVMFAGPFKGYGQLLIIEHGGGYHSLLAGLARIDSVIGQRVLAGEPTGVMGGGENGPPVLYIELRRNGQPINPLPWLAARKNKVNG